MIIDEARKAVDELKAQGHDEDEIIAAFYYGFKDGKINIAEFEVLMQTLGYSLSPEFLRNLPADGEEKETPEEYEKYEEEVQEEAQPEEKKEEKEDSEEEDAMRLFGK